MSEDVLERARDYTVTMGDHWKNGEVHDLVCDLAAEVRALRKDRERLDWLEGEMDRERQAIAHGMPIPRSLFRQNEPITRPLIDAALLAREGGIMDDVLERIERHAQWAKGGRLLYTAVVVADLIALAAEVRALRKDRERLDWVFGDEFYRYDPFFKECRGLPLESREQIDAAMAREGEA